MLACQWVEFKFSGNASLALIWQLQVQLRLEPWLSASCQCYGQNLWRGGFPWLGLPADSGSDSGSESEIQIVTVGLRVGQWLPSLTMAEGMTFKLCIQVGAWGSLIWITWTSNVNCWSIIRLANRDHSIVWYQFIMIDFFYHTRIIVKKIDINWCIDILMWKYFISIFNHLLTPIFWYIKWCLCQS